MKTIKILSIAALAFLLFQSCDKNSFDVYAPDELGMEDHEFYVGNEGGKIDIPYLSNNPGLISLLNQNDAAWLTLGKTTFDVDGTLSVNVKQNDYLKRRADILFVTDTRKDTVSVFQEGAVEEVFKVLTNSLLVFNGTDAINTIATEFNIPLSSIKLEVRISDEEDWIKDCQITDKGITFKTTDNPDKNYVRRAIIAISYKDGWGALREELVSVVQARSDNKVGTTYTFEELRNLATLNGYTLPDDAILEGQIVSTTEFGNAGDAVVDDYQYGKGTIDYTLTERTSYIEDGKYGFRLISPFEEGAEGNVYKRYSHVTINIGGAIVKKDKFNAYTIEDVSSKNILTSNEGTAPVKEKSITELTDDDFNTLVTIKDCEIAMRKGPFTPVNEGYTNACGYNRLAKYPIIIRDKKGGSMYMYTNMTCTYRRNGETLPYGSGDITGIVVHEDYKSFEKDGNIGRYQLRHLTREEIALAKDFKDNFSGLITEFRYAKFPSEFQETKLDNAILATKGNGEMCHTHGSVSNYSPSYFYIGECGSNRKGRYEEGAGIELDEGGIYQPWVDNGTEGAQNDDGKGWFKDNLKLSWSNKYWWDSDNSRGYCWLVNFSTEGITSDIVSMQFAMYNNSQSARSPRYWKAQYSLTTTDCSKDSDDQWVDIAEFTVPDVAIWASQNDWQTLGTRVYDFPLPVEILGHESVSIRLMPRNNKAAAKSVDSYDDSTIANNSGYNTLDYFAVRYNK